MNQEQIREILIAIQTKWFTPNSAIARGAGIDGALVSKLINDKLEQPLSINCLSRLENWIEERM